jgi:hypothetical protein
VQHDKDHEKHLNNAILTYRDMFNLRSNDIEKRLAEADAGLDCPEHPKDILEYLGNTALLALNDSQKAELREVLMGLIDRYGTAEVWQSRLRYKLEIYYISNIL